MFVLVHKGGFLPTPGLHTRCAPTRWVTPFFAVFAALLDDPDQQVHRNSCLEAHIRTHLQPREPWCPSNYYAFKNR